MALYRQGAVNRSTAPSLPPRGIDRATTASDVHCSWPCEHETPVSWQGWWRTLQCWRCSSRLRPWARPAPPSADRRRRWWFRPRARATVAPTTRDRIGRIWARCGSTAWVRTGWCSTPREPLGDLDQGGRELGLPIPGRLGAIAGRHRHVDRLDRGRGYARVRRPAGRQHPHAILADAFGGAEAARRRGPRGQAHRDRVPQGPDQHHALAPDAGPGGLLGGAFKYHPQQRHARQRIGRNVKAIAMIDTGAQRAPSHLSRCTRRWARRAGKADAFDVEVIGVTEDVQMAAPVRIPRFARRRHGGFATRDRLSATSTSSTTGRCATTGHADRGDGPCRPASTPVIATGAQRAAAQDDAEGARAASRGHSRHLASSGLRACRDLHDDCSISRRWSASRARGRQRHDADEPVLAVEDRQARTCRSPMTLATSRTDSSS